ncbi:MGMT family protein [Phototrophicus methaneseepsis]|uniref:MGMT family protein n=2 Tax=Phototrophicus methaneseepsis TaxID=2710758 RepID=A0A7S8IGX7_9CHLR|nr:MGMT family protein [Phototrophicus methaneseepsis]
MWNPPDPASYNALVWEIVRQIPAGKVSTYGQIASMIPAPDGSDPDQHKRLGPRWVGSAMRAVKDPDVPWHRVINTKGEISLPAGSSSARIQQQRLLAEGILFDENERVDLTQYGWSGPDDAWLDAHDLFPPIDLAPPRLF